jgi:hypothetical protein
MIAERMIKDPQAAQAGGRRLPGRGETDSTASLIMTNDEGPGDYRFQGQDPMIMPDVPWSGRWRDRVYYMRGGRQCWRRYVVPKDPRTPAQLRQRAALSAASKAWSHSQRLTEEQRQDWRVAGAKIQSRPRLSQSGPLTGQQHYVGRNCTLDQIGREMLWGLPQREGEGQIRSAKVEIRRKPEIRGANGVGRRCGRRGMILGLNELHWLNALHGLQRDVVAGWDSRRMHTRSTWEQCRGFAVVPRLECRRGEGREGRRKNVECRRKGPRGHWRELWHGG